MVLERVCHVVLHGLRPHVFDHAVHALQLGADNHHHWRPQGASETEATKVFETKAGNFKPMERP